MARAKRTLSEGEGGRSRKLPCTDSAKPERNALNDGLLNLYKKERDFQKEKSQENSQDESTAENKSKENGVETSKTPIKSGKRNKFAALTPKHPTTNFDNIGGMDRILNKIHTMFLPRIRAVEHLKDKPPLGILFHGPPGCGKTFLAHAIAGQKGIPIIEVSATELVRGISGESESMIRDVFAAALATGRCILFIDEIDAICRKRETSENDMMKRMVTQVLKCFDELKEKDPDRNVLVIGATNMPDSLDIALRQGSRFTHEIAFGMPDEEARLAILKVVCKDAPLEPDFDFGWLAHNTPGCVGADLENLLSRAIVKAKTRILVSLPTDQTEDNEMDFENYLLDKPESEIRKWVEKLTNDKNNECADKEPIKLVDFKVALKEFVPTSKREGFISVPDVTWDEIGSYHDIKEEIQQSIVWPIEDLKFYTGNKLQINIGILLYGPKGCGKTLLAKAIANQCNINFLAVNGPELLNMYVGESERAVRKCFERARNSAPCIIFFDEFDALCPPRSLSGNDNQASARVVNQLLIETSGVVERRQVFIIAATNRLDKIDSAMLRPGRFDKIHYVGLPSAAGRVEILKSCIKDWILEGVELEKIALDPRCEHFSGADISNLVNQAVTNALRELRASGQKRIGKLKLSMRHFVLALTQIEPSVSEQERIYYETRSTKQSRTF